MPDRPRASCVVVAFHRPESLTRMLPRLESPEIEVILVNVDDDPAVASAVAAVAAGGSRTVALPGNPGYAAAVNRGAQLAQAPVVVFSNDDVDIDARAVLDLASRVRSEEADVVLPCVTNEHGEREPTIAALPTPVTLATEWLLLPDHAPAHLRARFPTIQKWRAPARPERVDAGSATVVAVGSWWLRHVPLPEDYFLYWEESDWFWRLRAAGARVVYDPSIVVQHRGGREDVRPTKSRLLARNAVRCVRRTQGRRAAAMAWPVVVLWNLRLLAVDGLRTVVGSPVAAGRLRARLSGLGAAILAWREV